jgi:hypothetical protein
MWALTHNNYDPGHSRYFLTRNLWLYCTTGYKDLAGFSVLAVQAALSVWKGNTGLIKASTGLPLFNPPGQVLITITRFDRAGIVEDRPDQVGMNLFKLLFGVAGIVPVGFTGFEDQQGRV